MGITNKFIKNFITQSIMKTKTFKHCISTLERINSVPRAGVEPARIAPLVFETSASTDSAIWAIAGAKVQIKIEITNFLAVFF